MVLYGMVLYGMVLYGIVLYGIIWYDILLLTLQHIIYNARNSISRKNSSNRIVQDE